MAFDFTTGARHSTPQTSMAPQRVEIAVAGALSVVFLVLLSGQLPYHDVARFANQVNSGQFVFDIAHVNMQPLTLMWHRYLGFGEAAVASQRHINIAATAAAVAIFHALLLRLRVGWSARVAASVLVLGCCSVMILAPTGHMKLLAFPFVNAALYGLVLFEQDCRRGAAAWRNIVGAGLLLAVAASLLVSALATAPFAALAVLVVSHRVEGRWGVAFARAVLFGAVCGLASLVLLAVGFALFAHQPLTWAGIMSSVQGKADLKPAPYGLVSTVVRLVFGTGNNMVAAPAIGPLGHAWLAGYIPSLRPFAVTFALQAIPLCATLLLLAVIYVGAVVGAVRGAVCLVPLAFLAGAQSWTIYYGLNDPEHWFQLTAPTVLLFLLLFPTRLVRVALPIWAAITLAVNLALIGIPTARYPLLRYQTDLAHRFSPNDLLLSFAAYPGGPNMGFFPFPGVPRMRLDQVAHAAGNPTAFYTQLGAAIDAALARHGQVFLFAALNPADWNSPWPEMMRDGITKVGLQAFLSTHYGLAPIAPIAEIKAWQIKRPT